MFSYEELDEVTRESLLAIVGHNHGLPVGTRVIIYDYDNSFYKKPKNGNEYELARWEFLKAGQQATKPFFGKRGAVQRTELCVSQEYLTKVLLDGESVPVHIQSYFLELE